MALHAAPARIELLEDSVATRGVEEGGDAGCLGARRAAGDGKGKGTLDRVEVSVLREGELELVAEGLSR